MPCFYKKHTAFVMYETEMHFAYSISSSNKDHIIALE